MALVTVIIAAVLLPALFILIYYLLLLARPIDDPEIKARRRWRMMSRGNALWVLAMLAGVIVIAEAPVYRFAPAVRAAASILFVAITFFPLAVTLGIVDKRIRGIDYPLAGYLKFQLTFFFCRWTCFLVLVALMYVPLRLVRPEGGVSYTGVALAVAGAVLFAAALLFQMRLVGRITGMLTPVAHDREPARTVTELAGKAGVGGVRLYIMETFGYPFYNAFAAPGKTIYVTRPVLGALSADELSAIAAHEIGHLVTMRQRTALMVTVLSAGVVGLWILIWRLTAILPDIGSFIIEIAVGLFVLFTAIFALRAVSRRYETRADATATELVGGPEAVISALEKLYALNMLPRRFDKKGSENASHPSLERRVAQLKGETLPRPKRRARVILIIALVVLILSCLRLIVYFDERSAAPASPGYSGETVILSLEERLAGNPDDFDALKRLAIEYFFVEEDERALEMIDRALGVREDPGLLVLKGFILDWRGEPGEALAVMEEAVREGGGPQSLRWAIVLAVGIGDIGKAQDYLTRLKAIAPADPYAGAMESYLSGDGEYSPFPDYVIVFQGTGR